MEKEVWKDVEGYEGVYRVSNLGYVKSVRRIAQSGNGFPCQRVLKERILKGNTVYNGYIICTFYKNNKATPILLHRVVAQHFVDNPLNKPFVNHIDGNKLNNAASNLEWCTSNENMRHAWKIGLRVWNAASKKVIQLDMQGNEICIHSSIQAAVDKTGIPCKRISGALYGDRKSTHNFIWKFAL